MICPECGKKLPDDAGFCVRCGANQNNPYAEVYKKTKSAEQKNKNIDVERTRILNIIPDDIPSDSQDDSDAVIVNTSQKNKNNKPAKKKNYDEPEKTEPVKEDNTDEEDDIEDNDDDIYAEDKPKKSSSRLAVLTVICVILLVACIVIYFFTGGKIRGNSSSSSENSIVTSEVIETTEEIVTTEAVTETTAVQTSVVTDANANEYTIELMNDVPAIVSVDDGSLRLRAYPSTESSILGEIPNGEQITVKGSCGEWYYVVHGDREGYVFSEYVELMQSGDDDNSQESVQTEITDETVTEAETVLFSEETVNAESILQ